MNKTMLEFKLDQSAQVDAPIAFALPHGAKANAPASFKLLASDVFAFLAALVLASGVYFTLARSGIQNESIGSVIYNQMTGRYVLFLPLLIFTFMYGGLYNRSFWESRELQRIVQGVTLLALIDGVLISSGHAQSGSYWMLAIWPLAALLVSVLRMVLRCVPFGFPAEVQNVLLVGSGITPEKFEHELRESRCGPVNILRDVPLKFLAGLGMDAIEHRLAIIFDRFKIPSSQIRLVVAPSCDELHEAQELVTALNARRQPFCVVFPVRGLAQRGLSVHQAIGADFILTDIDNQPTGRVAWVVKRMMDLVLAVLALVLLAPLLVSIAGLLKLEGGPVFFTQLRVGQYGRRFLCIKFRSMRPDAEERLAVLLAKDRAASEEWKRHQKLANDPRVTRLGEFLRTTSLDELPQLFNVITGDMSMVGPRPIIAPEVAGYESDRKYYESEDFADYASCKPGITGLWQVSGRAKTTHRERVRLDRWYYRNWSIWLDVMLILKTVRAVLIRTGS